MPKTYYYTTNVKGNGKKDNGKPYQDGKVHSVTVLSDPNNRTNKNHQIVDVFRKAEEMNEKQKPDQDKVIEPLINEESDKNLELNKKVSNK